jgi:elongation factor G
MAHIDAGKTTCAERILFFAGRIRAPGEVHDGNTVLDFDPLEQQKGITINAAATSVGWTPSRGPFAGVAHRLQIVDTPGHIDFTVEVERSLRVLDGAVFVLDASQGVECQSETVFRQAERHGVRCLAFVNKIDKVGADFDACLRDLEDRLGVVPVAVHLPVGEGTRDATVVDVLARKVVRFEEREAVVQPLPPHLAEETEARRRAIVEVCAEHDPAILAAYCEGREVDAEALARALRRATLARKALVVTCGSALENVGIQPLLDAVVDYLPSPADLPPVRGTHARSGEPIARAASDAEPLAALAFKSVADAAGRLTYVRIYSGVIEAGAPVLLGETGARARVGRVYLPHADEREEVRAAAAGAIVAVTGLRDAQTGDTICAPDAPIALRRIDAPEPLVEVAIEPRTADDRARLSSGLAKLVLEDPSLRAFVDDESGQTRLRGMGRLHLEIAVEKLARDHRVSVSVGRPEVAYRETIHGHGTAEHRHIKQSGGGSGQYACVTLAVEPSARGAGITFVDRTTGGVVPRELVPAVEKGVRGAAARGALAGYPIVDVVVSLVDGRTHVKDSNAAAFEIAGSLGFQKACRAAGLVLLEPRCVLEITVPERHGGTVLADLGARRATVLSVAPRGGMLAVEANAPLAATFDYAALLRGLTQGRGGVALRHAGYEPAPADVAAHVAQ